MYDARTYTVDEIRYEPQAPEYRYRIGLKSAVCIRSGKFENWLQPVPVTPVHLQLLGLADPSDKNFGLILRLNNDIELTWYLEDQLPYGEARIKYRVRGSSSTIDFRVKSVHHLQNWFFALTGEELTIKETT